LRAGPKCLKLLLIVNCVFRDLGMITVGTYQAVGSRQYAVGSEQSDYK